MDDQGGIEMEPVPDSGTKGKVAGERNKLIHHSGKPSSELWDLTAQDYAFLSASLFSYMLLIVGLLAYVDHDSPLLTKPIRFVDRHSCYYLAYMIVPYSLSLMYWFAFGRMPHLTERALEINEATNTSLKDSLAQAGAQRNIVEIIQAVCASFVFIFLDFVVVKAHYFMEVVLTLGKSAGLVVGILVLLPKVRAGLMCHELSKCQEQDHNQHYLTHELMDRVKLRAWIARRNAIIALAVTLACIMSSFITVATSHPVDLVLTQPEAAVTMAGACNISQAFVKSTCLAWADYEIGLLPDAFHFCSCLCVPRDGFQILANNCSSTLFNKPDFLGVYAGVEAACQAVGSVVPSLGPLTGAIWLSVNVVFGLVLLESLVLHSAARSSTWVTMARALSFGFFGLNFAVCCPIYAAVVLAPTDKCFTGRDTGLISGLFISYKNLNGSSPMAQLNTYTLVFAILLLVVSSTLKKDKGMLITLRGGKGKGSDTRALRELAERQLRKGYSVSSKLVSSKFVSPKPITVGRPEDAALGLNAYMDVGDAEIAKRRVDGVAAIKLEFEKHGTDVDKECLHYCLNERAGSSDKIFPNSPYPRDCDNDGVLKERTLSDGQGMLLDDFVEHPFSKRAKLTKEQVLALRVYTTAAYESLNSPLRDRERKEPHGFPLTLTLLKEAIGKLRALEAPSATVEQAYDLFRGMRNVVATEDFIVEGGTDLAPMSTTSDFAVALRYCAGENALLFVLHTDSFMSRGADIAYISCFPQEAEYLFPPLTYLRPTGKVEDLDLDELATLGRDGLVAKSRRGGTAGGAGGLGKVKVVEVIPHFNA